VTPFDDLPTTGTLVVREGAVAMVSEGAARILGRTVEELQSTPFVDLFVPEERERIADRYRRRMRGDPVPNDYEAEVLRADGSRATLELHVDREGRDVVVHYRDITQEMTRRQRLLALATLGAEIQRERDEAHVLNRLRTDLPRLGIHPLLMQASPAGVRVVWSQLPQPIEANFVVLFGRRLSGFVGRWSAFSRKVWDDGAAFTDDWGSEAALFVPDLHATRARELAVVHHLARAIAVRIDERSGPRFYLVMPSDWLRGDDLAAARLFAAQVAAALDAATAIADLSRRLSDLTALHALTGRIFANPAGDVRALLRDGCRESAAALSCQAAAAFLVEEGGTILRAAAQAGEPLDTGETFAIERDRQADLAIRTRAPAYCADVTREPGSAFHGRSISAPAMLAVPLVTREAVRGVLYLADLAGRTFTDAERALAQALAGELAVGLENARLYEDLRLSYEALARTQRQLIHKERLAALGELSAVVAHEVRNPLGVIFNSLGSLRRMIQPSGDAKLLLDIVGEEADRLNRIVGDLLDFARPITPILQPCPLEAVVDEAIAAATAEGKAVVVDREADADLPPVPIDARLVRQAVLNLASNAVQAMPRGGWLRVRMRAARGGVLLELEDTGPGIPDEIRAHIFEPFFTTKAAGTGLGLAVVKRIVDGHGGEVSVEGAPAGGTLVRVYFPAEGPSPEPAPTALWSS
jgi:PAS domain S-box-containing protein